MTIPMVAGKRARLLPWRSLVLNLDRRSLHAGESHIPISPAEFDLLRLFISRRHIPLTKEHIMSHLFGPDHGRDVRQADVFVARLRRGLATVGLGEAIGTVAGRGYALIEDERLDDPAVGCLALAAA